MLDCAGLDDAFAPFKGCQVTSQGLRVSTDCLLPSFEQLHVFIVQKGTEFIIHDDGAAARSGWDHGADHPSIKSATAASARAFSCDVTDVQLSITVPSREWLWSGVVTVANASADAARRVVGKTAAVKESSVIQIAERAIKRGTPSGKVYQDYLLFGESGREYRFDLGVMRDGRLALVSAVSHYTQSIAAKHLAFSDAGKGSGALRYIVHTGDLTAPDKVLLSNVADLIALEAVQRGNGWNVFA